MSGLVNGRRVASLAFGLTLLAATLMLAPAPSDASGHGRGSYGGHGGVSMYGNHGVYAGRAWYGGRGFYGGARYSRAPGHYHPRSYFSFGFGLGLGSAPYYYRPYPYYYPHSQPYVIYKDKEPEKDAEPQIDVENEPPKGTYYYDPYCDLDFKSLDDYTHHLDTIDDNDHPKTIDIVSDESGKKIRSLEFVDGYWSVKQEEK